MSYTTLNAYYAYGTAANLPANDTGLSIIFYYATDTDVLYVWNGTAWVGADQWTAGSVSSIGAGLTVAAGALAIKQTATISSNIASGAGGTVASATPFDVTNIVCGAGDWLVYGNVGLNNPGTGTVFETSRAWTSLSSATDPGGPNNGAYFDTSYSATALNVGFQLWMNAGVQFFHFTGSTTIYLSGEVGFSGVNPNRSGFICAVPINAVTP